MDVDQKEPEKPKMRKVKKQVRKGELPLSSGTASLDQAQKDALLERENQMFMEDKLVLDTEHQKNELESFIYELRGKIDDIYAEFSSEDEKAKVRQKLETVEVRNKFCSSEITNLRVYRTGSTTKAKMPPRLFTSVKSRRSDPLPGLSFSDTMTRSKRSGKHCSRSKRKQRPLDVPRRRLGGRQKKRRERRNRVHSLLKMRR